MSRSKSWAVARRILLSRGFWAVLIVVVGATLRLAKEMRTVESYPITSWEKDSSADCGVVLTGGAGRVHEGFDLLADRRVKKLIISGVHRDARLRELITNWTFYGSLHEEDVVLEKRSETTWGNAQQSLPIVEALHCRDVLLITSRLHMWRALHTFKSVFPDSIDIQAQAVVGNRYEGQWGETLIEAVKSLFYSVWAY